MKFILLFALLLGFTPPAKAQVDSERINRIFFAIADGTMIAGAISTFSAQGERGKRHLGYLLILAGIATIATEQAIHYSVYGETDFTIAANFSRDCHIHERFPRLDAPVGLASLAEGIDLFRDRDTRAKVTGACRLFKDVSARASSLAHAPGTKFTPSLAYEATGAKSLSDSDLRVIQNMFRVGGVL